MLSALSDWLLDRSIFFSFDRSGFERHARHFRPEDIDADLRGKVCLITGANSGIGYATALALAQREARVTLLCRNHARGVDAVDAIRAASGNANVSLEVVDVASLSSVRAFVERCREPRIDVLIHNAGVLPGERTLTGEGIESTLATNVVGPFLLTRLLEPRLDASGGARVIFVASGGLYSQRLSVEDPNWSSRPFDGVAAYAQTKRMQVVLTDIFARRRTGETTSFHAMHPGWADTPAVRSSLPRFWDVMRNRLRTPAQGADTVVFLAAAPIARIGTGQFWFDRAPQATHLLPFLHDDEDQKVALWRLCEKLSARADTRLCQPSTAERLTVAPAG